MKGEPRTGPLVDEGKERRVRRDDGRSASCTMPADVDDRDGGLSPPHPPQPGRSPHSEKCEPSVRSNLYARRTSSCADRGTINGTTAAVPRRVKKKKMSSCPYLERKSEGKI